MKNLVSSVQNSRQKWDVPLSFSEEAIKLSFLCTILARQNIFTLSPALLNGILVKDDYIKLKLN